ncbi:MAG TPA: RNA methyltransferase, partial [Desulfobacterales bacterium]|nr:RNA methyltransferase [Desulfobacterales bacterium]
GLAKELIDSCDFILDPIAGNTEYNHLSVRSAASIYLDRIINDK